MLRECLLVAAVVEWDFAARLLFVVDEIGGEETRGRQDRRGLANRSRAKPTLGLELKSSFALFF